jgi:hypothetical protein
VHLLFDMTTVGYFALDLVVQIRPPCTLTLILSGREIFNDTDFFGLSDGAMLPPELAHFFLHLGKF